MHVPLSTQPPARQGAGFPEAPGSKVQPAWPLQGSRHRGRASHPVWRRLGAAVAWLPLLALVGACTSRDALPSAAPAPGTSMSAPASPGPGEQASGPSSGSAPGSSGQSSSRVAPETPGRLTLLLLADIRGVLRPCGCTKELQLGGFDRLGPVLQAERALGATLTLHAGPLFFEDTPQAEGAKRPQRERQAAVVTELCRAVGLDLVGRHPLDEARDPARYQTLTEAAGVALVPASTEGSWVAAAPAPGQAVASPQAVVREAGGVRVGIVSLAPPLEANRDDEVAALGRSVAALRRDVDVVLALSGLGLRETRRVLRKVSGIDFAVVGGMGEHPTVSDELEVEGGARLVQLHREGRHLGRLVLERPSRLQRPAPSPVEGGAPSRAEDPGARPDVGAVAFTFERVKLPWTLPQDPHLAGRLAAFDEELAKINLASVGKVPEPKPGEATYVGVDACFECHAETKPFWQTTRHAIAWETLEKVNKTFDVECVSCHVTGYGRPGGSLVGQVSGREDVQCEACHGPGSLHAADGDITTIVRDPPEATCVVCHNSHHSPSFAYGPFREKLRVPGHGRPVTPGSP
jgi:hypothetical protein